MRVPGHGLQHEGKPVAANFCCVIYYAEKHGQRNPYGRGGHGLCSCGAISEHESTTAARQRWHREHKREVASAPPR